MKNIGLKLKEMRLNRGLSLRGLSIKCQNTTHTTIDRIEKGEVQPLMSTLQDITNALCIDINSLLNDEEYNPDVIKVAIYGTIPAGIPTEMIDQSYIEEYEEIPREMLHSGFSYFGLKVKGDSMYPEFRDGDTIIFRKQDTCENGEYCAVSINHTESTFKKVLINEKGITLQPLNPAYEPKFFTNEQVTTLPITILGVIVEVRRKYGKF